MENVQRRHLHIWSQPNISFSKKSEAVVKLLAFRKWCDLPTGLIDSRDCSTNLALHTTISIPVPVWMNIGAVHCYFGCRNSYWVCLLGIVKSSEAWFLILDSM